MDIEAGTELEFEEPVDVIVWASRVYLTYASRGQEIPDVLEDTFEEARLRYMYDALVRVLNQLLTAATTNLTVHEAHCPCTAFHEQALITALRSLQIGSARGYIAAMSSILPLTVVRLAQSDMAIIASALGDIERFWPFDAAPNQNPDSTVAPGRRALH